MPIAVLTAHTTADLATRMQWATTMFDTTQANIDDLLALEAQLKAKQATADAGRAAGRRRTGPPRPPPWPRPGRWRRRPGRRRWRSPPSSSSARLPSAPRPSRSRRTRRRTSSSTRERAAVDHRIQVRIAQEKAAARGRRGPGGGPGGSRGHVPRPAPPARSRTVCTTPAASQPVRPVLEQRQLAPRGRPPRLHLPGVGTDHLAVRHAVPPDPAHLEAARRHRLRRRLRHRDPRRVRRRGGRAATTTPATATG